MTTGDTSEFEESTPAPEPSVFITQAGRVRGLLGSLFFGMILLETILTTSFAEAKGEQIVGLVFVAVLMLAYLMALVRPVRVTAGPEFTINGLSWQIRTPSSNLRALFFDANSLQIVFHDLAKVESHSPTETERIRKRMESSCARENVHVSLFGFTLKQIEELREKVGLAPPTADEPAGRVEQFNRALVVRTPKVLVTTSLIAINTAFFIVMVFSGVHPLSPTPQNLIDWGANYGPRTTTGEWWRLLSSTFLHIGLLHLCVNMWALFSLGLLVERLFGNVAFLLLYLIAGLCGSIASLAWSPLIVSAGASGSIFGLLGAVLGFALVRHHALPPEVSRRLRKSSLIFIGFNLFFGFTTPGIDNAAHLGGFAAGLLGGLLWAQLGAETSRGGQRTRALALTCYGCLVVGITACLVPRVSAEQEQYLQTLLDFEVTERQTFDRHNEYVRLLELNQITETELAARLEQNVLPAWRDIHKRLRECHDVPPAYKAQHPDLLAYLQAREEAWTLMVRAIRDKDDDLTSKSQDEWNRADRIAKRLNPANSK